VWHFPSTTPRRSRAACINLFVETDAGKREGAFWIAPKRISRSISPRGAGPATTFPASISRASGWSETANIYTVVYDNAILGAMPAPSTARVTSRSSWQATGEPGWHFIDLYPAIYKGKENTARTTIACPQLTFADDHPGEDFAALFFFPVRLRGEQPSVPGQGL